MVEMHYVCYFPVVGLMFFIFRITKSYMADIPEFKLDSKLFPLSQDSSSRTPFPSTWESVDDMTNRVRRSLISILSDPTLDNVLIVTHGFTVQVIAETLCPDVDVWETPYCCLSRFHGSPSESSEETPDEVATPVSAPADPNISSAAPIENFIASSTVRMNLLWTCPLLCNDSHLQYDTKPADQDSTTHELAKKLPSLNIDPDEATDL
eukprot:TRINITY_DN536_c0_g1::TRINITY_DN536_c0_g1_i1::g.10579::m.10579 TRINITY_DN536_c0_g1::TRINITY_DN536_c0_g1_i1::g.10579  ORF type:complete len:208 (+),score=16.43,His_Phos_1/PF00300.17/0.00087 TRINITY_DN536_c0_g1_i1:277-900(+)